MCLYYRYSIVQGHTGSKLDLINCKSEDSHSPFNPVNHPLRMAFILQTIASIQSTFELGGMPHIISRQYLGHLPSPPPPSEFILSSSDGVIMNLMTIVL